MNGKDVWVSNVALLRGEVIKYLYRAGGSTLETFYTGNVPVGIAVIPPPNP